MEVFSYRFSCTTNAHSPANNAYKPIPYTQPKCLPPPLPSYSKVVFFP